jgi:hypothetical protein
MSENKKQKLLALENTTKQIPVNLRQHLREANIQPVDENHILNRLRERLTSNVVSYLQVIILKLRPPTQNQETMFQEQKKRLEYCNSLQKQLAVENL